MLLSFPTIQVLCSTTKVQNKTNSLTTFFPFSLNFNGTLIEIIEASLIAQLVKNLPAMLETWVQFQGQEDPLEKGLATHSSILA